MVQYKRTGSGTLEGIENLCSLKDLNILGDIKNRRLG
jgi:hypothetical protein